MTDEQTAREIVDGSIYAIPTILRADMIDRITRALSAVRKEATEAAAEVVWEHRRGMFSGSEGDLTLHAIETEIRALTAPSERDRGLSEQITKLTERCGVYKSQVEAGAKRIAAMREALEPFAKAARQIDVTFVGGARRPDDMLPNTGITMGDLRRAALAHTP